MASTFVLKRKTFADNINVNVNGNGDKKKSGLGKKLAIGAGTVAATGLAFAGARRGWMGAGLQKSANTAWMRAGKHVGKVSESLGQQMQGSAQKLYQEGQSKYLTDLAKKSGKTISEDSIKRASTAAAQNMSNKVNGVGVWETNTRSLLNNAGQARSQARQAVGNLEKVKGEISKSNLSPEFQGRITNALDKFNI